MRRSYRNVLAKLVEHPARFILAKFLPDGNGHCAGGHCASGTTLRDMRRDGLIEYGKDPLHSHYGYRITDAGREAVAELK